MTLLAVSRLAKHYALERGFFGRSTGVLRALDGVDLTLAQGETLGIVGESGSGKTTLARCLLRLIEPTAGEVLLDGEDLLRLDPRQLRARRQAIQMVFQDPYGSLDPRQRVSGILGEPLQIHRLGDAAARRARIAELLELVGLPASAAGRYPHEFSGGQRQRIGIARALATSPRIVVADEPVSALDVSVRAQILNLLAGLQERLGLAMIFIGHDLAVVEQVADRVAVMYLGKIVEEGPRAAILGQPLHPYTRSLLAAAPTLSPLAAPPSLPGPEGGPAAARRLVHGNGIGAPGCPYAPRCPIARDRCRLEAPELLGGLAGRRAACHYAGETTP